MEMKMGMRRSTRQELRKLREIAREILDGKTCLFCKELLISEDNSYGHGDGEGSPFATDLTLHHRDGDHSNNDKRNRVWTHRRCHKSYHLTLRHKQNRKLKRAA
jgi:hypothetical protein